MSDRPPPPAPLVPLVDAIRDGARHLEVAGLPASSVAFLLAELFRATGRTLVAVAPTAGRARGLAADTRFFLGPAGVDSATDPAADPLVALPPDERGPYSEIAPDRRSERERLAGMFRLHQGPGPLLVVADADTLARRTLPRREFDRACDLLARGEEIDRDRLLHTLTHAGYTPVGLVEDEGTFAVRGGIVDIFCPLYAHPFRLELLGDEVESLRFFDPATQRSLATVEEVYLCPVSEVLLSEQARQRAERAVRELGDELTLPTREVNAVVDDLRRGHRFFGLERLLPALTEPDATQAVLDYLPADALVVWIDPLAQERAAGERAEHLAAEHARLVEKKLAYPPDHYRIPADQLTTRLATWTQLLVHDLTVAQATGSAPRATRDLAAEPNGELAARIRRATGQEEALRPLVEKLEAWIRGGGRAVVACRSAVRAGRLAELFGTYGLIVSPLDAPYTAELRPRLAPGIHLAVGELAHGFRLTEAGIWFVAEEEFFGAGERDRRPRRARERFEEAAAIRSFRELNPGDRVVHVDHGVAVYCGLERIAVAGLENDFLRLEFAGQDKLFVPVDRLQKVHRYVGSEDRTRLDRLGGASWARTQAKVRAAVAELARDLLKLQAARASRPGLAFPDGGAYFAEFEAAFPFTETPDQTRAIEDVLADMGREQPMDRLVCGDVGFGKTEVAMRAAFRAVLGGRQVAVLAPTTILAQQHGLTFRERLGRYPVVVEVLSRFRSRQEQADILRRAKAGEVDVLIGTHRLLGKDVGFRDLGLLIIDEEHRFGVRHKERIKALKTQVDVLTLTATPIPRTLYMGFSGLKDLSIIATPPADRLSLRTYVMRFDEAAIRESILSELARGGQVFFVHNRVQSLPAVARMLGRLVPEARIAMAHGQMSERTLERVMLDFVGRRHDVLACTAIIESGLDIPSANTMIVNRADLFGLSQLYQLRGRIGRGTERAYCYLIIPGHTVITREAQERLQVLQRFSELGAGFQVASHDLEARGAGNLLGPEQSGHVAAVGFDLYTELLNKAVAALKGEAPVEEIEPEIVLPLSARIPEEFVADGHQRLVLYKRLSMARSEEDLVALREELVDRFGPLPEPTACLLDVLAVKARLRALGAAALEVRGGQVAVVLGPHSRVDPRLLVALAGRRRRDYSLSPDHRLSRPLVGGEGGDPLEAARNLLREVEACAIK